MVLRAAASLLAVAAGCSFTQQRVRSVSKGDVALESGYLVVTALDWAQTENITRACNEANVFIGKCGGRVPVDVYFPAMMVLHAAASLVLPHGWARTAFQGIYLGMEAETVYMNWMGGVRW